MDLEMILSFFSNQNLYICSRSIDLYYSPDKGYDFLRNATDATKFLFCFRSSSIGIISAILWRASLDITVQNLKKGITSSFSIHKNW